MKQRGKANADAQFFKIKGGIPSGSAHLFVSKSKSASSTLSTFIVRVCTLQKFSKKLTLLYIGESDFSLEFNLASTVHNKA
jgi:hypothetical protein